MVYDNLMIIYEIFGIVLCSVIFLSAIAVGQFTFFIVNNKMIQ